MMGVINDDWGSADVEGAMGWKTASEVMRDDCVDGGRRRWNGRGE